ncbi:uncharacterized protein LOC21384881 [Morus notabilis]|uniref:uncharacterized protein LOC21384881 n=1 Tax=Morus notabilis TaxID=981085 RepID=UPI000CECFAD5|nr:uncharacterized protein LOC21384881 [Morus notabilis]
MEEREIGGQKEREGQTDSAKTSIRSRTSLKTHPFFNHHDIWKRKLRENCYKRVREDRRRLVWKMRVIPSSQPLNLGSKDLIKSAFKDIVSDELKKLKDSSSYDNMKTSTSIPESDDILWEYGGLHDAYQGECEEILLEMQMIFYEDLSTELARKEPENYVETWEDEEDEYLSHAVYEHLQLNEKKLQEVIWCPICKRGELQENQSLISCNLCELQLRKGDEVNLELLRVRLAEVHAEHLDRGCVLKPKLSIETRFDITALYIFCTGCSTFEVVI